MSTYIPTKTTIDILPILEIAKELFPHADWAIRVQLEGSAQFSYANGVQFYDKHSLLRFSILSPLKLYFSIDESEGTIFELDNLETITIKQKLIESKDIYKLSLLSVDTLLNLVKEEFPSLNWAIKELSSKNQYICFTSNEYIDIELTLKELKLFKNALSVKIPLKNDVSLANLKARFQEGQKHLTLMSRFDATLEAEYPYTPLPIYTK